MDGTRRHSITRRVGGIAAVLVLLAAGSARSASRTSSTTLRGRLQVTIAMSAGGTMNVSDVALRTDDGRRYHVHGARARQLEGLSGQQLAVVGDVAGNGVTVDTFQRLDTFHAFSGARRAAVIRVRAANSPLDFMPAQSAIRTLVFDGTNSLANMWRTESHGRLTLTGDVFDEVLPRGTTDNCPGGTDGTAQVGSRHPGYDFYLYVSPALCGDIAGQAQIGSGSSWYYGEFDERVLWHEMGHNLGFNHSNALLCHDGPVVTPMSPNCGSTEFGDGLTPMGGDAGACAYSAYQEIVADWDVPYTQVNADAVVKLRARNLDDNGLPRAILVPGAPAAYGGFYMLEWRTSDYPSCRSAHDKGLQIRVVGDATEAMHTQLVDATPGSRGRGFTLAPGKVFRDPMSSISIKLVSRNLRAGVATVQIRMP